jgi:hypothetical protein
VIVFNIFNLKPFGLADLTASTVLDVVPHSITMAKRHLPCSCGNLDKRSLK